MEILVRKSEVKPWVHSMFYSLPGGGKTWVALTSYSEKYNSGPIFFDCDKHGADTTALDVGIFGKFPIIDINMDNSDLAFYALMYPHEIVEKVNKTPGFEEYKVNTFVFDTTTLLNDYVMGEPEISMGDPESPIVIPGSGIMKVQRKRDKTKTPAQGDYKALNARMRRWFLKLADLQYHVIVTAHAGIAVTADTAKEKDEKNKRYAGYPLLGGQLKYDAYRLIDHFFYMEQTDGGQFVTWSQPCGAFNARSRLRKYLEPSMPNFTFKKLKKVYKQALAENGLEANIEEPQVEVQENE